MKALLEKLKNFANKYKLLIKNTKIGIAISGGPDSVFLLNLLHAVKNELNLSLYVLHFNHKIRKKADEDEIFVKELAKKLKIPFFTQALDVIEFKRKTGLSLEHAARIKRYEFFSNAKAKLKLDFIATGHTKDDFVETLLMNLIRGSSIDGLVSLKPRRDYFIRPILAFSKSEIEVWLINNNIEFRRDETNLDKNYTRNKIRLELIPHLEEFNPNIKETLFRFGMILLEDVTYINKKIETEIVKHVKFIDNKAIIDLSNFDSNPSLIKRTLSEVTKKILDSDYSLSYENLERLKDTINTGKQTHLRKLIKAKKEKGTVIIERI